MLKKAAATVSDFASDSFRSEVSDWTRLTEWAKRNPARWIYGIAGVCLSLYLFLSHKSHTAEFIAEHRPLKTGEVIYDLLVAIWLAACMFSFFSERPGTKWFRRSLVVLMSSAWLLNLWDVGPIGIVWIAAAWMLFFVVEHGVATLDEAARRVRSVKYVLFTVALSASYTSPVVALLLNDGNLLGYWPLFAMLWGVTGWVMRSAYLDRSDSQGSTLFSRKGLMIFVSVLLISVVLAKIAEIAVGIPADFFMRSQWIQQNSGVSDYWADLINSGITMGLLGTGLAVTWLSKTLFHNLRRRLRASTIHAAS